VDLYGADGDVSGETAEAFARTNSRMHPRQSRRRRMCSNLSALLGFVAAVVKIYNSQHAISLKCCIAVRNKPHRYGRSFGVEEWSVLCKITKLRHTHPFNGAFSGTTQVSQYQKGETSLDFTEARDSEWQWHCWAIRKSAPCSRQITTPAPHHSVVYRPDALPVAQPTASKH